MTPKRSHQGFTLIELLTVIAIIAVLAAILMPVFARVKETARQATCMSNMHELYLKASLYKQDNADKMPPLLLGVPENPDGTPWTGSGAPVDPKLMQRSYLYPKYVQNIETFRCPNNSVGGVATTAASYAPTSAFTGPVVNGHGVTIDGLPEGAPISFYSFDSYDITAVIGGAPTDRELVYALDWTGATGPQDAPHQLKYRNPPPDKTILTWCNFHAARSGSDMCTYVTLSGTAKTINAKQMNEKGWNLLGR